jgi:hypothetical protein
MRAEGYMTTVCKSDPKEGSGTRNAVQGVESRQKMLDAHREDIMRKTEAYLIYIDKCRSKN